MKGSMLSRFKIGDFVKFSCGAHKAPRMGTITKLHKSGSSGVAEIHPNDGVRKRRRSLRHVEKVNHE